MKESSEETTKAVPKMGNAFTRASQGIKTFGASLKAALATVACTRCSRWIDQSVPDAERAGLCGSQSADAGDRF